MAMSRKNYRAVAESIKGRLEANYEDAYNEVLVEISALARDLARVFKQDNHNFRYDKFFEACGLDSFGYHPSVAID